MNRIGLIEAPSDLGLKPTGVRGLPEALLGAGLLDGLAGVRGRGRVAVPGFGPERDPVTGVRNASGIRTFSTALAEQLTRSLDSDDFPIVLGGDCSILLGIALALKQRGRFGLLFIDGHADFYSPEAEPNGEVASMELAILTGRPPQLLEGLAEPPLLREQDVIAFGYRDAPTAAQYGSPDIRTTAIRTLDMDDVRRTGPARAARESLARLEESGIDGFWIHLDADVLDDDVMPAVDYRMPGGLAPHELADVLPVALASPLAIGLDITIHNPALDDHDRSAGHALATAIRPALAGRFRRHP